MTNKKFYCLSDRFDVIYVMCYLIIIILTTACNNNSTSSTNAKDTVISKDWISLNIAFKPNTDQQTRNQDFEESQAVVTSFLDSIDNSNAHKTYHLKVIDWKNDPTSDSLHYHLSANLQLLAGDSITPPSPPIPCCRLKKDSQ